MIHKTVHTALRITIIIPPFSEHIPPLTGRRIYTPYFRTHTPSNWLKNIIPLISEHIPPLTGRRICTPFSEEYIPLFSEHIPPLTGRRILYSLFQNTYPLQLAEEYYTPYCKHIPPLTGRRMCTSIFRTHMPYHTTHTSSHGNCAPKFKLYPISH